MSTNYTGVPTATQAPSGPPVPGGAPVVRIPADGDAENAASITQMIKAVADWVAWLFLPRSRASQWVEEILIFRDAALRKRFGIDHLGFPGGQLNIWPQDWGLTLTQNNTGTTPATQDGWYFNVTKTTGTGQVTVQAPSASFIGSRLVHCDCGDTAADYSYLAKAGPCLINANNLIAMQWDARIPSLQNYTYVMGFHDNVSFITPGHGTQIRFYNNGGAGNWRCQTDDGTTQTDADSGVAIATGTHRFRIEFHGAAVDEAGAERALFFIDGALVANVTTTLPSIGIGSAADVLFGLRNAGGTTGTLEVGAVRGCNTMWTDAFI